MADKAKQYLKKLLETWKKYSGKQKTLIISAVCIVVIAFALLIFLMRRTEYSQLITADNAAEANTIVNLLKDNGYKVKVASDNVTISVDSKLKTDAVLLLAGNDIPTTGLSIDDLLNNSLSTTNYDRTLKLNLYFQNQMRNSLLKMEGIEDAEVYYLPSDSNYSILEEEKETSASVILTINDDFDTKKTPKTIAKVVAAIIGNTNADLIKVADQYGNLLYGGDSDLYSGNPVDTEEYKELLRNNFKNLIYMGLIRSGWDDAVIMPNLKFNMDKVTQLYTERIPADGQEQGVLSHGYTYESQNAGSSGGVPGTDSNDELTYEMQNSSSNSGSVNIEEYDYLPNERVTNTEYEIGALIPNESSVSIVLRRAVTYKEEKLKQQGVLDDITFEDYALENDGLKKVEPDESLVRMVSKATGIAEDDIDITAYEQPIFVPKEVKVRSWTDYLQIILTVLIVGLLAFVLFKSFVPVEVTELEPELSVEQLLATTKENQTVEDIEFNEVSEVRKMIEKFVDEKPEAVAQLLRNWLNEDWN